MEIENFSPGESVAFPITVPITILIRELRNLSWRVGVFCNHDSNGSPYLEVENFSPGESAAFLITILMDGRFWKLRISLLESQRLL